MSGEDIKPLESWDGDVEFTHTPSLEQQAAEAVEDNTQPATAQEEAAEEVAVEAKEEAVQEAEERSEEATASEEPKEDLFKVKIDGKEQEVSLDELKSNYSGKTAWDKKFTELDKERKQFLAEKQEIEGYVNKFNEISRTKGSLEGAKFLAQLTGKSPHEYINGLIKELMPEIQRRQDLSDEELSIEQLKQQQEFEKQKLESEKAKIGQEQAQRDLETKINNLMTTRNISNDEWDAAFKDLDARLPKEQPITPELMDSMISFRRESRADVALNRFEGGKHASDQNIRQELVTVIDKYPDLSDKDLQDILNESLKASVEKEIKQKVVNKAPSKTNNSTKYKELESWDDY